MDGQRAGGDRLTRRHPIAASPLRGKLASRFVQSPSEPSGALGRIPGDKPKSRVVTAGEVDAGDLQVTTVQVTPVQRDGTVDGYFLEAAAAHAVVRAGNHGACGFVGEADGAVLCVADVCYARRYPFTALASGRATSINKGIIGSLCLEAKE